MNKEHIDIFKQYFTTEDEVVRQSIANNLSKELLQALQFIEEKFLNNIDANSIASKLQIVEFVDDIQQMQNSFNANNSAFEQELSSAIKITEREFFKKKFNAIDAEDEVFNSEIKSAITQVEREALKSQLSKADAPTKVINFRRFVKYAAAAVITGVVAFSGYLLLKNNTTTQQVATNNISHKEIPKVNLPQQQQYQKVATILEPESYGFTSSKKDTFSLITHIVLHTNQIDSIKKNIKELEQYYIDEITGKDSNGAGYGSRSRAIKSQLDSFQMVLQATLKYNIPNTYTFALMDSKVKVDLYLTHNVETSQLIALQSANKKKLYIKIDKSFYTLTPANNPAELVVVKDQNIIEQLSKILFQNQ